MDREGSSVGRPAGWGEVETDGAEEDAGTGGRDEGVGEGRIGLVVRGDGSGVVALNDEEEKGTAAGAGVAFELPEVARSSRRGGVREAGDTLHDEGNRLDFHQNLGAAEKVEAEVEAASPATELPLDRPPFPDAHDESTGEQIFRELVREGGVEGDPGAGRLGGADEGDRVAGGPGGARRGSGAPGTGSSRIRPGSARWARTRRPPASPASTMNRLGRARNVAGMSREGGRGGPQEKSRLASRTLRRSGSARASSIGSPAPTSPSSRTRR